MVRHLLQPGLDAALGRAPQSSTTQEPSPDPAVTTTSRKSTGPVVGPDVGSRKRPAVGSDNAAVAPKKSRQTEPRGHLPSPTAADEEPGTSDRRSRKEPSGTKVPGMEKKKINKEKVGIR
jgi:hypothetical protein